MTDTVYIKDSRCVKTPDCDGLWVQVIFDPTSQATVPDRYMVRASNVYQVQGDWAVLISGSQRNAVQRKNLGWSDGNEVSRWIHVPLMALIDIQNQFLAIPLVMPEDTNIEHSADEEWKGIHLISATNHYFDMIDDG